MVNNSRRQEMAQPQNGLTGVQRKPSNQPLVGYEIAHRINGRIRLRVPRLASDQDFTKRLLDLVQELPRVTRARANRHARSLVVEYKKISDSRSQNGNQSAAACDILPDLEQALEAAALGHLPPGHLMPVSNKTNEENQTGYLQRLGLPVLGLGLSAGFLGGLAIPPLLVGGTILLSAIPVFKRTLEGIQEEKKLTVDFLDSTAIVLLTAQTGFLASAFIVGVIEGSEVLRNWTARRSRKANLALLIDHKRSVSVERDGQIERILADDVAVGDILLVYPGDQIPVDGVVLDGKAAVGQQKVSGDSIPVLCAPGDTVHASSLVVDGYLRLQAQRTGHETHVGQVLAAMQAAPETDTRIGNYARKVGNWAVLPTLAIGGLVFGTTGSLPQATGIISMDLGTGMRVSTPIAVLTAQTNAARQGIIIRSGQALEALAYVDTIIFDKTATLTEGEAKIVAVEIEDERRSVSDLISLAASAEQALGHPIAESIVRYAHAHHIELRPCADWNYCAGLGIEAQIDGQLINVGNRRYMKQLGVAVHDLDGPQQNSKLDPATRVYVAADGQLLGIITCADPLRPQVAAIIAHLKSEGITPYLVSGDSQAVTSHVAKEVGINSKHVYAEMLPQQKLALVKSLQDQGRRVAFIGDGINDAAAMAHADVSITLNSATDLALETAGIVLTQNKLTDLLITLELSRHAMHIIGQNKALVIVPNVGGILYATLTVMNPIAGVVINNGSAAAAALNSLRPLAGPKKKRREKEKMPNLGHLQLRKIENGEL